MGHQLKMSFKAFGIKPADSVPLGARASGKDKELQEPLVSQAKKAKEMAPNLAPVRVPPEDEVGPGGPMRSLETRCPTLEMGWIWIGISGKFC